MRRERPHCLFRVAGPLLAFSHELRPRTVLTRPLAGRDVVLYRTSAGALRAVHPYCPHLGAHLGLAKIEGENLTCPFHFFSFGPDGACARTGYGTPPPRTQLTQLPAQEVNGGVFVSAAPRRSGSGLVRTAVARDRPQARPYGRLGAGRQRPGSHRELGRPRALLPPCTAGRAPRSRVL